jgi:hypothetical protein
VDYSRIYVDFIADRRCREIDLAGYVERHHILNRCFGGSDDAENIVRLTPEDHFFAHLLLARIHGGKMASALQLLADTVGQRWSRRMCGRRAYGLGQRLAARLKAEAWRGRLNPLFNSQQYQWTNYRTGEIRTATIYDMHDEFGASRASWTSVATGYRPSIKGWLLTERAPAHVRSEKGKSFSFINRDGRTFQGSQGEFAATFGLSPPSASRIIRHDSVTRCGWRRKGVSDRPHNYAKDGLPARQSRSVPSAI